MIKKVTIKSLFLILFLVFIRCKNNVEVAKKPPALYPKPKVVLLDTINGYTINQFNGDSIQPIIKHGDTLITGRRTLPKVKVINNSFKKPISITNIKRRKTPKKDKNSFRFNDLRPSSFRSKESQPIISILKKRKKIKPYFINLRGDTIYTGTPLKIEGKKMSLKASALRKLLPPSNNPNSAEALQFYNINQGLPTSSINSVYADSKGNIWICTSEIGVIRFDGLNYNTISKDEGLISNEVWSIIEDRGGNIWIGTSSGISKINGNSILNFDGKSNFIDGAIYSICEDFNGDIWFGTSWGASKYDGKSITHYTSNEGFTNTSIDKIVLDSNNKLWFATQGDGAISFNRERFSQITSKEGLISDYVNDIFEDSQKNIWFGNYRGLSRLSDSTIVSVSKEQGLPFNNINSIYEDNKNNIWFGASGGLIKFDGEYLQTFSNKKSIGSLIISSVIGDKEDNIWFNTEDTVIKLKQSSFSNIQIDNPLLINKRGNSWSQKISGKFVKESDKYIYEYFVGEDVSKLNYLYAIEDKKENLWLSTWGNGVKYFDGKTITKYTNEQGLVSDIVYYIFEDSNLNIWFASAGRGVSKFNGKRFINYSIDEGLSSNNVEVIFEDSKKNIWFGSYGGGVTKFDGNYLTHYTEKEGLHSNYIYTILEDSYGNMWFGSFEKGISIFNGESFTQISKEEGLVSDNITSVIENPDTTTRKSEIWVGTTNGLSKIDVGYKKNGSLKNLKTINYLAENGLNGSEFDINKSYLDIDGNIWLLGSKNVKKINTKNFKISTKSPVPILRNLTINEEKLDYRNLSENQKKDLKFTKVAPFENYPLQLKLPHYKNHLTFQFSGIDWNAPHKVKYSYYIEGLDSHWSKPSSKNTADYRNLPYGNYTFKLAAIGESNEWSKPIHYSFTILPPWWHTWWARILFFTAFLSLLYFSYKWRVKQLLKRQEELEYEVDVATKVIRKEKERSDELLLNILPEEVAEELKEKGMADTKSFDLVSVLFTDFKDFTKVSETLTPEELVIELNVCYKAFDEIMAKYNVEKIKTIGDAYMAASGLGTDDVTSVKKIVLGAFDMQDFIKARKKELSKKNKPAFSMRVGIHTGPVVAGIVGVKKFQYDLWGDTVNTASRMESNGAVGKVNISESTFKILKEDEDFNFEYRGKINAKGKGEIEMYFIDIKNE